MTTGEPSFERLYVVVGLMLRLYQSYEPEGMSKGLRYSLRLTRLVLSPLGGNVVMNVVLEDFGGIL